MDSSWRIVKTGESGSESGAWVAGPLLGTWARNGRMGYTLRLVLPSKAPVRLEATRAVLSFPWRDRSYVLAIASRLGVDNVQHVRVGGGGCCIHQLYNGFDMVKADISRFVGGRTYWPVALFLLGWLVLVGFRGKIQTQWWEMRLRRAPTAKQQEYYINLLSSAGSSALPVARSLLAEPDSVLRTGGIAILNGISGEPATSLLRSAIHDSEAEIREAAVLGLAMRRDPRILPTIEKLIYTSSQELALAAVDAYTSYGCEVASAPLCRVAGEHDSALMRARAIEQLGLMRCEEAIPTLIEALSDDARYDSSTLLEEIDRQALNLLSEKRGDEEPPIRLDKCRIVSEGAAFSLRLITRRSSEFHCGDRSEERQAAQTAWRNWWLGQREG